MAEGDLVYFGSDRKPPAQEPSWLGDTGRAIWGGVLDATAGLAGLGEYTFDDDNHDWFERQRKGLQDAAKEVRSRIDPERVRQMQSEFFKDPASQNASFWEISAKTNPISAAYWKLLNLAGSTIPTAVGGAVAGPVGAFAGAGLESGQTTGDIYGDLKDKIMSATPEQLAKVPLYEDAIASGYTDEQARKILVKDAGRTALFGGIASYILGVGGMKAGGREIGTILSRAKREGGQEVGQQIGELGARAYGGPRVGVDAPSIYDWANQLTESALGGGALGAAIPHGHAGHVEPLAGRSPDAAQRDALAPPAADAPTAPVQTPPGIPPRPEPGAEATPVIGPNTQAAVDATPTAPASEPAPTPAAPGPGWLGENTGMPGWTGVPPVGDPMSTVQPPRRPTPAFDIPGLTPPAIPPRGSPGAAVTPPAPDPVEQSRQAVAQLPPQQRDQLVAMAEQMRTSSNMADRIRIARDIARILDQIGLPTPWAQQVAAQPAPTLEQAVPELASQVQVAPGGPGPATSGIPPRPPPRPPTAGALANVPSGGSAIQAPQTVYRTPLMTPTAVSMPAAEKARVGGTVAPHEGTEALHEALVATNKNELAGVTQVKLQAGDVNAMVDTIVRHAMASTNNRPDIAAYVSAIQTLSAQVGSMPLGVDRRGDPVHVRDLLLPMAEHLQGSAVKNVFEPTLSTLPTQTFDRFGKVTQQGRAEEKPARPAGVAETRAVGTATQEANRGLAAAAMAYAGSDNTRKENVVKAIKDFVGAVHRAVLGRLDDAEQTYQQLNSEALRAEKANAGVTAAELGEQASQANVELRRMTRANQRLGEAQSQLSGLRSREGTVQAKAAVVFSALKQSLAVMKDMAPQSAELLERALQGGIRRDGGDVLDRVLSTIASLPDKVSGELSRIERVAEPTVEVIATKPSGTVETGGEGLGIAPRQGPRLPANVVSEPRYPVNEPVRPASKNLPEPASAEVERQEKAAREEKREAAKQKIRDALKKKEAPKPVEPTKPLPEKQASGEEAQARKLKQGHRAVTQLQALDPMIVASVGEAVRDGDRQRTVDVLTGAGVSDPEIAAELLMEVHDANVKARGAAPGAEPAQGQPGPDVLPAVEAVQGGAAQGAKPRRRGKRPDTDTGDQRPRDRGQAPVKLEDGGREVASAAQLQPVGVTEKPALVSYSSGLLPEVKAQSTEFAGLMDTEQLEGVDRMVTAHARGLTEFALTDGTGVGKTRQEIAIAVKLKRMTGVPSLIITENQVVKDIVDTMDAMGIPAADRPEVASYNDLSGNKVEPKNRSVIVFDEAHNLKNQQAQKSVAARKLPARFVVRASATLFDNVVSGANTVATLTGRTVEDITDKLGFTIKTKYTKSGEVKEQTYELKPGNTWGDVMRRLGEAHNSLIKAGSMVRRVLPFYGKIADRNVSPAKGVLDTERTIENYWQDQYDAAESPAQRAVASTGRVREMRAWSELSKIEDVKKQITQALADGKSVVVVAESVNDVNFKADAGLDQKGTLSQLADWATGRGLDIAQIYGNDLRAKKYDADRFRDGKVRLALITPGSGGTGISLDDQVGDKPRVMIVMTRNYAGDRFEQVLGRISRKNTRSASEVRILHTPGSSADAHGQKVLQGKLTALHAIQAGTDPMQSKLEEDIAKHQANSDEYRKLREKPPGSEDDFATAPTDRATPNRQTDAYIRSLVSLGSSNARPSLQSLLSAISEHLTGFEATLADRLARLVPAVPVYSMAELAKRTGNPRYATRAGVHNRAPDLTSNFVGIGLDTGITPTEILLHEATHAVMVRQLRQDPQLKMALGSTVMYLRQALRTRLQGGQAIDFALENADELLAYGFTSESAQAVLSQVTLPADIARRLTGESRVMSMWNAFIGMVRRALGLPSNQDTALEHVIKAGVRLLNARQADLLSDEAAWQATKDEIDRVEATQEDFHKGGVARASLVAAGHSGILDDLAARPGGVAERVQTRGRGLRESLRVGALYASSLDFVVKWYKNLVPRLAEYQELITDRTKAITRAADDTRFTIYKGERLTAMGFMRAWSDLARKDDVAAKTFDRLITVSTEQQVHLDRARTDIQKTTDPLTARAAIHDRFQPVLKAMHPDWQALYPAVREFYQETRDLSRKTMLDRLRSDIGAGGADLTGINFDNLKSVAAAVKAGRLAPRQQNRIKDIHAKYGRLSFYAPLSRRGDFVVRGDFDVEGDFSLAEATDIRQSFPDRRMQWEAKPNGMIHLRIRPSDAVNDPTDPAGGQGGQGGRGEPIGIYERFENRSDADRRLRELQALSEKYVQRKDVRIELTRMSADRLRRDPSDYSDPTLSRTAQLEMAKRIDEMLPAGDRARMKKMFMETTAGMLPDTYIAKSRIRRRFIAGASQDQLRALGEYITAFSHNVGHMLHDRKIEEVVQDMEERVGDELAYTKGNEREIARHVIRSIKQREAFQLDRARPNALIQAATGVTYFWQLTSASFSVLQMTQPFMVGIPTIGGKYGMWRASQAMRRAVGMFSARTLSQGALRTMYQLAGRGNADIFDFEPILNDALKGQPDEARLKAGLHEARDAGVLDLSQAREIYEARTLPSAHRGERHLGQKLSRFGQWAMDWSRMMPHAVEVQNRAIVFTAAYRLEYEKTADQKLAVQAGIDAIRDSQIDYSRANKPLLLQHGALGGVLRIPLMFKQYALHMYSLFALNAMKAWKNESPGDRKQALKTLTGLMSTHAMAAGAAGIMLEPIKIVAFMAAAALTGSDGEDEWDFDRWAHEGLREMFGPTWGEVAFRGLPALAGVDISSRVGLNNLLLFSTLDDIDHGKSAYEVAGRTLLGPTGSLAFQAIPDAFKAWAVGDVRKGVETLMPKFAKDFIKANRMGDEGILDRHGNRIDRTLDVDTAMLATQALGFRPVEVANLFEGRDAIIGAKQAMETKHAQLLERFWRSRQDPEERYDVMRDVQAFNRANPRSRITMDALQHSMRERRDRERQSGDYGVYLPRSQRYLRENASYLR